MAIIAIFILIGLAYDSFAERTRADVVRIVTEDRIATILKVIEYLESHEKPATLAVLPEYLAMKKVIAEAEKNAGKRHAKD
ncbi:MAG: hypothetical protein WCW52_02400 [Elusimicrobiales bacterium]|jgi:hypothetical protein